MKAILFHGANLLSSIYAQFLKVVWKLNKKKFHKIKVYENTKLKFSHYGDIATILYSLQHLVRFNRGFEFTTLSKYHSVVKQGDVILDIGANIGLFSILGSKLVGASGKVYAFEPNVATYDALKENIRLNDCTNVYPQFLALSDKKGFVVLTQPEEVSKDFQYSDAFSFMDLKQTASEENGVATLPLDDFLVENSISKVDVIKIDIEGAEFLCFKGAIKLLSSPDAPIIIMECDEQYTGRFDYKVADVIVFLYNLGYRLEQYEEGQWIAFPK
ncbi:FkbM family methyltransferase [Pedobacter sp. KR3-3]|uniref:FkbM family methyltransferase n=1 Tax=Pedobacter albus TaxID=3113905 RepID=A0ABU7IBI8_9SPHI|nr:FkbM family methyltransferase [Pedobacter sp. KR3-3]MEE1946845.1 FkbM family methyltransferase [Pedobacter sp. KR3-3]